MTDWNPTTIRLRPATVEAIDELSDETGISRSELMREKIRELVDSELSDLPEHVRIRYKRDQIKDESAPEKYRGYFRSNMMAQARQAWDKGLSAQEGAIVLKSFLEEEDMLFGDDYDGDIDADEVLGWCEGLIELYKCARYSDRVNLDNLESYHRNFPNHDDVLDRAYHRAGPDGYPPDPDEITGWEPSKKTVNSRY